MQSTPPPNQDQQPSSQGDAEEEPKKFQFSEPVSKEDYDRVEKARSELLATKGENKGPLSALRVSEGQVNSAWMHYSALGFQMVAVLLLPIFGGLWLDSTYDTSPLGILVGSGLGVAGSMTTVIMSVLRQEKREEAAKRRQGSRK